METIKEPASLTTRDGSNVMLEGVRVEGNLKGLLLEMAVEQRFRNPTDKHIEVVYTFPLPWGAVLLGVEVMLGDKKLTGSVIEKKSAEAQYEEALSEGDAAIMLERNGDHSYSLNLGNLAAKETCVITLHYAQVLQFEQRGLRLLIPTVIAPRYGDPVKDGGMAPHQAVEHDLLAEYPFDITLRLHGDLAKGRVLSPSHPISTMFSADMLTVSLGRQAWLDRDFVLVLDQLAQDTVAVVGRDSVNPEHFVALASFCPRVPKEVLAPLSVKILVDCSGSMAGDSIAAARKALQSIVQQFGEGDRFSLSRFGDTVEHRARSLWRATDKTRLSAQRWVNDLDADMGGTRMGRALSSTFKLGETPGSDVLLLTDGEIEAIDETIRTAKLSGHRLFIVGIGSSPAESHLRRLAEATGGACDFVAPGETVAPAVLRMFARLRSPRLNSVHIQWPDGVLPLWSSQVSRSTFDGDTVNVFAVFGCAPIGQICLMGQYAANAEAEVIGTANLGEKIEDGDTLARMAAFTRMATLTSDESGPFAVSYQLVTDRTNFLLVHERTVSEKATEMPELHKVAPMVPAGWGGYGRVMFSIARQKPAVWSRSSPAYTVDSTTLFDVPAFLRRESDDGTRRISSKHWISEDEYEGMSPIGLSEALRKAGELSWPRTYRELSAFGIGEPVIDWLEHVMECSFGEMVTVRTFLYIMSNDQTWEALMKQLGTLHGAVAVSRNILMSLFSKQNLPVGVDPDLLEQMMQSLEELTANEWPEDVLCPDYENVVME